MLLHLGIHRVMIFPSNPSSTPHNHLSQQHLSLSLDGVLALWEVGRALDGLLKLASRVLLGETATDGTGLLGAEVEREVLLVLVEQAELGALVGVDDGQDLGDGLADVMAVMRGLVMPCHLQAPNHAHPDTSYVFFRDGCDGRSC